MSYKKLLFMKGLLLICIMLGIIMASNYTFYAQAPSQENSDELVLKVLGLESSGDCIIIEYNNVQILIDASQPSIAEEKDSWPIITKSISECLEDDLEKTWDYMIFTHPDKDHIGNAKNILNLFYKDDNWKIGTIIDFDMKEAPQKYFKETTEEYKEKRDKLCKDYKVEYFSAASLSPSNKVKEYKISDDLSLYVLYNYYDDYKTIQFYNKNANILTDKDLRNNISVCVLLIYKDQKLLFTGDLEENGEKYLVTNHSELIENVTFFKANHHGSQNANSELFLDVIRPSYVSITKMNTDVYTALGRLIHYTDYIYPTYVIYDSYPSSGISDNLSDYYMLFGEQEYVFDGENVIFNSEHNFSDNNDFPSILDATISYADGEVNWYNQEVRKGNIVDSIAVYVLDEGKGEYNNCTLVKYGHYDILIDCGSTDETSAEFIKKLKTLITDGKIEYLIVTHYQIPNISQLVGTCENHSFNSDGVLDQFEIGKIIDGNNTNFKEEEDEYYKQYIKKVAGLNRVSLNRNESEWYRVEDGSGLSLNVWGNRLPPNQEDENNYSLVTLIRFYDKKILFVGDLVNYTGILTKYNDEISNIDLFRLSHSLVSCENMQGFGEFLSVTNPKYIAIGSPLGYDRYSSCFYDDSSLENLNRFINIYTSNSKVYFCGSIGAFGGYESDNGDLKYFISKSSNQPSKKDIDVYGKNGNKDLKSIKDKFR